MAGAELSFKVDVGLLVAKADEMNGEKSTIIQIMDQAKAEIASLTGIWKSVASDEFQNRFRQVYDDIDNMLAITSEHISDIKEVAEIYARAESAAATAAEGLPTDGVLR